MSLGSPIPLMGTLTVVVLTVFILAPLLMETQNVGNSTTNYLPEGALESGPLGEDEEEDGEIDLTESGDGEFSGVRFDEHPEAVVAGGEGTFRATANADQQLEGATFFNTIEGTPDISGAEVSVDCIDNSRPGCTVERSFSFPETENELDGYEARVEVQFTPDSDSTDSDSLGIVQTNTQVVDVELNFDSSSNNRFSADADAERSVLTDVRLGWTTDADVEPSENDKQSSCTGRIGGNQPAGGDVDGSATTCDLSMNLPNSLGGSYDAELKAEFLTLEGQVTKTKTKTVQSDPGLEVKVMNDDGDPVEGIQVTLPKKEGESEITDDIGIARFDSLSGDIDEIKLVCSQPDVDDTRSINRINFNGINPSTTDFYEFDTDRDLDTCQST